MKRSLRTVLFVLATIAVLSAAAYTPQPQPPPPDTTPPVLTLPADITADGAHTCAVLGDGTPQCWGWNKSGQLGDGTTTNSNTPVTVTGLT